jgi:hypothetical protein
MTCPCRVFISKGGKTMAPPKLRSGEYHVPGGTNFLIRIQYQQYSSWQGTIQWLELNKTLSFRSVLEMIHLMEEALSIHTQEDWEKKFRHWERREGSANKNKRDEPAPSKKQG